MSNGASPFLIAMATLSVFFGCTAARNQRMAQTTVSSGRPAPLKSSDDVDLAVPRIDPERSGIQLASGQETDSATTSGPANNQQFSSAAPDQGNANPSPPPSSRLTLAELETLALQHNPTLVQAQAEIEVDQGLHRQAGLYPNPQVGYINGTASNPAVKQSNGVFLSQEFVTAHKLELAQQSILQEIRQMQWDQEAQRMRVLNDLKIRYYEVLGAQRAIEVATKMLEVANDSVALTERMLAAKNATRSDVLQAKVQLETTLLNLEEAEFRYSAAWKQLAVIVGISGLEQVPLDGELIGEIPELDLETCWQNLRGKSPQLAGSASGLDHGWAEYRSQCAQATPNLTVQSVIDYDRATQATTASTLIAMPLPVYNRNQGNIDRAAADIRLFQAEICRVELVLRDLLADSFRRYQASRKQVERLNKSILPHSEENLRLSREIYAAGESSFTSVLTAQQTYFQSQMAYVEAWTELNKVLVEIDGLQLSGGLNPPAIGSAIQAQSGGGAQRQRALLKDIQDRASKQLLPAAQIGQ